MEQWLGISLKEVIRMRQNKLRWIQNRYPLIEIRATRADCMAWWQAHYPGRPLVKSACMGCPFQSRRRWVELAEAHPGDFQDVVEIDRSIRVPGATHLRKTPYMHRTRRPLDEAVEPGHDAGHS